MGQTKNLVPLMFVGAPPAPLDRTPGGGMLYNVGTHDPVILSLAAALVLALAAVAALAPAKRAALVDPLTALRHE